MKAVAFCALLALISLPALAQFSAIEKDGDNSLRLLGSSWKPSFFSLASIEPEKLAREGGRISTYNYITLATHTDDFRIALRFPFQYNTAGTDRFSRGRQNPQEFSLQDLIVGVQNSNFWLLPFDIGSFWEGRIYLPTSKFSRDIGQIARLRNDLIFSKPFNRWIGLEYSQKFSWYLQSRTAYSQIFEDENGFVRESINLTKRSELDHRLAAWLSLTPALQVAWEFGAEDTTWNSSPANGRQKSTQHLLKTGPQARFPLGRAANFIVALEDKVDAERQASELGQFLTKNTTLSLFSFIRF